MILLFLINSKLNEWIRKVIIIIIYFQVKQSYKINLYKIGATLHVGSAYELS